MYRPDSPTGRKADPLTACWPGFEGRVEGRHMNIVILANHYAVASGRYIADALRRAGHTVLTTGPAHGARIWGLYVPPRYVWEPQDVPHNWADVVIVADSDPACLDASEAYTAPAIVWGVDNHVRDYTRRWIEHYFLAHRGISLQVWDDDCTHLPCAYDPVRYTPSEIPWSDRAYDVALLGVMYPQRWEAVYRLRAAGLKVIAGTGLVYETYRDAHHNSRIALSLSACGDVGQRVFEAAAMGCVVMSDNCADYRRLKPEGIWIIEDLDSIADEAQTILNNPNAAQAVIEVSRAWAEPQTWDARAEEVLTWIRSRI